MISARHPDRFKRVLAQFQSQLPHSLMEFICHLPPALELALLAEHRPSYHQTFDFSHYLEGSQSYESLSHQLWQWTLSHADKLVQVNKIQQAVWLDKVLRKQAWSQVANRYQLAGRKAVENLLKTTLEQALKIKDS
jgi:tRNA(Met) cytidine acetyltransferase